MSEPASPERERLLAEFERRTGEHPRWLDGLTNEGIEWHLRNLDEAAALTPDDVAHHPFKPRIVYKNGERVVLENECGACIDAMLNAPAFDPVYCGRSRGEHDA